MPETTNETYHPMAFDAIKIGLASPEKIRSWTHRTPDRARTGSAIVESIRRSVTKA